MHSRFLRINVFCSLLFVVVEGYKALDLEDEAVDALLVNGSRVENLRRFRNATFHYQGNPLNEKLLEFLDREDGPSWTRSLHSAFEAFFHEHLPIDALANAMKRSPREDVP